MKKLILPFFDLECGATLKNIELAYSTYGELNQDRSNVVLVHHALTGNTLAGEWWSGLIGPGKKYDTDGQFILSVNALGSCYGSTGPDSVDPKTRKRYGLQFPAITIRDIARCELTVLDHLGIETVQTSIGGSMGAMVALELALLAPRRIRDLVLIAAGASHSAWRLAFSATVRHTIESLVRHLGEERGLAEGLRIARQFATISYRSSAEFDARFGRERMSPDPTEYYSTDNLFEVESYLHHHGDKIVNRFSPYSYSTLTRAMELFDVTRGRNGDLAEVLQEVTAKTVVIGISSDVLYPEQELVELAELIPNAEYQRLDSIYGHDSFLVDQPALARLLANANEEVAA